MALTRSEYYVSTLSGSTTTVQTVFNVAADVVKTTGYARIWRGNIRNGETIRWTSKGIGTIDTGILANRGLDTSGVGGSGGLTWQTGDNIACVATAAQLEEIIDAIDASSGTTSDTFEINTDGFGVILDTAGLSADRTFTFPNLSGEFLTTTGVQTAISKTFTSPVINTGISGTAFKTVVGTPGVDTLGVTEKAVRDAIVASAAAPPAGITITNGIYNGTIGGTAFVTTIGSPGVDTKGATEKAIRSAIVASVAGVASFNGDVGAIVFDPVLQSQIFS